MKFDRFHSATPPPRPRPGISLDLLLWGSPELSLVSLKYWSARRVARSFSGHWSLLTDKIGCGRVGGSLSAGTILTYTWCHLGCWPVPASHCWAWTQWIMTPAPCCRLRHLWPAPGITGGEGGGVLDSFSSSFCASFHWSEGLQIN